MKLNLPKKYYKQAAMIWTVSLMIFVLTHFLIMAPQKRIKNQLKGQLDGKNQILNSAQMAARADVKQKRQEQLEQLHYKLGDYCVDFDNSANMTFDISQIASENNVSSFGVDNRDKKSSQDLKNCKYISENKINIDFESSFNQFAAVLNALERNRPVVFIDKFKITRSSKSNSLHKVDMGLSVFVRKQADS